MAWERGYGSNCCSPLNFYSLSLSLGVVCFLMFIVSIPFVFGNGLYLFQLFDQFSATLPLLIIGFFEFIAIGWVVGVKRYVCVCVCDKV